MKFSKATVLTASAVLLLASAVMEAATPAKNIQKDLSNAVLHISSVQLVQSGNLNAGRAIIKGSNYAISVETDNLLLTQSGAGNVISSSSGSNILGGEGNQILSSTGGVIIAGSGNKINNADTAVIGGGIENEIAQGSKSAVIAGGMKNKIRKNSAFSTILGGSENTISGTGSSIAGNSSHVTGSYSVAMGKNAKVSANNTFLWTATGASVSEENVFAVIGQHGMAISTDTPHPQAQLTIGGGLILDADDTKDSDTCNTDLKGHIKLVKSGSKACLCSCNGSAWDSVLGEGQCAAICDENLAKPSCGDSVKWEGCSLVGTCGAGSLAISGTHAYHMDSNGNVHWTCQAVDGSTTGCQAKPTAIPNGCVPATPTTYSCQGITPGNNTKKSSQAPTSNKNWEYVANTNATLNACQWTCQDNYERDGNTMNCKPKPTPTTYSCTGPVPSSNVETGSAAPTGGDKEWTERKIGTLGACEFRCKTGYELNNMGRCVEISNKPCSETTTGGYSVPNLTHGQTGNVTGSKPSNGATLSCSQTFRCNNGKVERVEAESCSCGSGYSVNSGSTRSTLHNGSCAKLVSVCGTAHGTTRSDAPSTNAEKCSVGQPSAISGPNNYRWTWSCAKNGYQPVSCYASQKAQCGPANGLTLTSEPTDLMKCTVGYPAVGPDGKSFIPYTNGGGEYIWNCLAGDTQPCKAIQGPKCGTAIQRTHRSTPTSDLCELGTASAVLTHGHDGVYFKQCGGEGVMTYAWSCDLGGRTVDCHACSSGIIGRPLQENLCGPLAKMEMDNFPDNPSASDLCQKGTPGSGPLVVDLKNGLYRYQWICTHGTSSQNCIATSYCGRIIREGREEYTKCR